MNSRRHILETRIREQQGRWNRLSEKIRGLSEQKDKETRWEERARIDALIREAETARREVECEWAGLENEGGVPAGLGASNPAPAPNLQPYQNRKRLTLFYSYAHEDEAFRERLEVHLKPLKREGILGDWHDGDIGAGAEWAKQISSHLDAADIVLLLVSADFLASDYIWDIELKRAMERHESGTARVIPVILRDADWSGAPFGKLQALPKDAKPVTRWPSQDAAFRDIAGGIRKAAEELVARKTGP